MGEVFTRNFFTIGTIKPGERKCFIPGIVGDIPDLWECKPKLWKWDDSVKIIGASLTLLCFPTGDIEVYACVCRGTDIETKHNFAAMKKEHLFYAQRDSYAPCVAVNDLTAWQTLPQGDYFVVSKEKPIYVKVGVFTFPARQSIDFDVIVNLYYTVA